MYCVNLKLPKLFEKFETLMQIYSIFYICIPIFSLKTIEKYYWQELYRVNFKLPVCFEFLYPKNSSQILSKFTYFQLFKSRNFVRNLEKKPVFLWEETKEGRNFENRNFDTINGSFKNSFASIIIFYEQCKTIKK